MILKFKLEDLFSSEEKEITLCFNLFSAWEIGTNDPYLETKLK